MRERTPIDIEELRTLVNSGMLVPDIAEYYGKSKDNVHHMLSRAGIPMKKLMEKRAESIALFSEEFGCQAASIKFKISIDSVYTYRHRYFHRKTFKGG